MFSKEDLKKAWNYVWNGKGVVPLLLNILIAFLLVKYIIYPGLGLIFNTELPVVAVVSGSMSHNGLDFDSWWGQNEDLYIKKDIPKEKFLSFSLKNGFNKGDIMVLYGTKIENLKIGDVIVYKSPQYNYPVIHRAVGIKDTFETKGDHNLVSDPNPVRKEQIVGKAILRIPYLGWVKIIFTELIGSVV